MLRATLVAVAVAAGAGCADQGAGGAPPGTTTDAGAAKGFGDNPATASPASTTKPKATAAATTVKPAPRAKPVATPPAVVDWADVVEPCPNQGQKVEIQRVFQADLTGDGLPETLVTRSCEASTSYWASTIEVFDGSADPRSPRRIGKPLLAERARDDEPVVTDVSITAGIVGVKAYGTSPKGTKACPDLVLFYRYEYTGAAFRLIWRDWGTSAKCEKLR